jgi:tetratricopeptide (TPR) repeat protein
MKTVTPPPAAKQRDETKATPTEIEALVEWARRCAEGGRIVSPPKDNLKYLLDQIDRADPGNAQAEVLKQRTTSALGRKGMLALKKQRLDEAGEAFENLLVLKPDDDWSKQRLARTLVLRSQRSLGKNKNQAALADATAAMELEPDDANTQLQLADVHLAMGKHELAAEEYQRVLDVKPMDKRAKLGLAKASAPPTAKGKAKPIPKKRKARR